MTLNENRITKLEAALSVLITDPQILPHIDPMALAQAESALKTESEKEWKLHIEGRRWFNNGNTYHSVRIWEGYKLITCLPYQYGYGDQYLQTALDWLKANGKVPQDAEYGTRYLREVLGGSNSVIDVTRKKDL